MYGKALESGIYEIFFRQRYKDWTGKLEAYKYVSKKLAHICATFPPKSILKEIWNTGGPLIVRFLGPRKKRTNGNPYY